jgi:hypothetical protein
MMRKSRGQKMIFKKKRRFNEKYLENNKKNLNFAAENIK